MPQPNYFITVGLAKETTWGVGVTPATVFLSCANPSFSEKQDAIFDKGLRGIRSETQGMTFGAGHSEINLPDMPWYGTDSPHLLMALMGTDTLTSTGARTGAITAVAPGGPTATYTPNLNGASVTGDVFKIIDGVNSEVVKPTSIAANVWTMPTSGPGSFRFSHGAATQVASLYEHALTVLNTASPPSYTLQKYDALVATARTLAGVYFEEVTVKFSNPGKMTISAKGSGKLGSQVAKGTAVFDTEPFNVPWQAAFTINNVVNARVVDFEWTMKAPSDQIFGMNATQSPTGAVTDQLSVTGKYTIVPDDYTEFNFYTANTQPPVSIELDNGSTETVFQMSKCALTDTMLDHSGNYTILNGSFEAISNNTDVTGASGNAPMKVYVRNSKNAVY